MYINIIAVYTLLLLKALSYWTVIGHTNEQTGVDLLKVNSKYLTFSLEQFKIPLIARTVLSFLADQNNMHSNLP